MKRTSVFLLLVASALILAFGGADCSSDRSAPGTFGIQEGFADTGGMMIITRSVKQVDKKDMC